MAHRLSSSLHASISLSYVNIGFFNRIVIHDFYVQDQHQDTLLYSPRFTANIEGISLTKKQLRLHRIQAENARVFLSSDSTKVLNLQFIIDAIKGNKEDTTRKKLEIAFRSIRFTNSQFHLNLWKSDTTPKPGLDVSRLALDSLNFEVADLEPKHDSVFFFIRNLQAKDSSGFKIARLNTTMSIGREHMHFTNIDLVTPSSHITAEKVFFDYDSLKQFQQGIFGQKVHLDLRFKASSLHIPDLAYFVPALWGIPHSIEFSGNLHGMVSDFKGRNIDIHYNHASRFYGNIDFTGLPNIHHTYIYLNIKALSTSSEDVRSLRIPSLKKNIILPPYLDQLGVVSYTGKFTGFFDNFNTYGKFNTHLGAADVDIVIEHDTINQVSFKGRLSANGFNAGPLIVPGNQDLGKVSLYADVDGKEENRTISAQLSGMISSLAFKKYEYHNIHLEGTLSGNAYDGNINIDDPNLRMNFLGRLDFSQKIPEFDFTANIPKANPYKLNLIQKDSALGLSCILTANFVGSSLNDLNGDIKLLNAKLFRPNQALSLYNVTLNAQNQSEKGKLVLHSDFIDAEMEGQYNFGNIGESLSSLIAHSLPSIHVYQKSSSSPNNFTFRVNLKNPQELLDFFSPSLSIAKNSKISGNIDTERHFLQIQGYSPLLSWNNFDFANLRFETGSEEPGIKISLASSQLTFHDQIKFFQVAAEANLQHDSILCTFHNLSTDSFPNKGFVHAFACLKKKQQGAPAVSINIEPSEIFISNNHWTIDPAEINLDSAYLAVDHFRISNGTEALSAAGTAGLNEQQKLHFSLNNFMASRFNILTSDKGFSFTGTMNGNADISNLFSDALMLATFDIDSLGINGETLGNTTIRTYWSKEEKRIGIRMESHRGNLLSLDAKGSYTPSSHGLDIDMNLNKLRVNILRPYLSKILTNLNGLASGNLHIGGNTQSILLDGNLDFQKTSFMIDYLQTRYTFSDKMTIQGNRFLFDHLNFFDENGNKGTLSGYILGDKLKEWSLNLSIAANNMLCLNTTAKDNNLFYGRAIASGNVNISGPIQKLKMDITATTEKGTEFNVPLNSKQEVSENSFIVFTNRQQKQSSADNSAQPNFQSNIAGMDLNFELTITPDAEAQLIFDPKMGDIIKGRGNGNLRMEVSTTNSKFRMYGDYVIEEGDYLFTLQNVINKKFKVENGGTISWNGNPTNANLNIKAVYPVKTSVYDLLVDDATEQYKKRIPIECQIFLTDKLMNPTIRYDIALPTAEDELKTKVRNAINTQEELSKQFLSLLVLNSFMPDPNRIAGGTNTTAGTNIGATSVGVTTSELLSNQLSNWLSQISRDFDVGVNYRPGDEITSQQVEVALSTQLLNDRVSINGNLDVGGNELTTSNNTNTSNIAGDFVVDIKLNESGKLRLKAFNRANDKILYDYAPYTQGVGVSYREEFNNFGELLKRYWHKLFSKKEDQVSLPPNKQ